METSMETEDFNIPDDIELPFQCYTCDINDMNNEQPEIITHILIPKTKDSLSWKFRVNTRRKSR